MRLGPAGHAIAWLALSCAIGARVSGTAAGDDRTSLPHRLADTGLYSEDGSGRIDPANRPFSPQYPLWTDGMTKRRWVQIPRGTVIDGRDEHAWNVPVGTKFWKEFSLRGRKVETRLLWKTAEDQWAMASYVWNEAGTDATLAPEEGVPGVVEVAPGRRHSIPARSDCTACHGNATPRPLGFTALQLSPDRDPGAIHGTSLEPDMVTVQTLVAERRLAGARADLLADPPRIRTTHPLTRSVLGYLSANCGMCHNGAGEIAALGPVIRERDLVADADAVAQLLIGQPTRWQMPGVADSTVLVHAGRPEASALLARVRSRSPSSQMPPLGTVVRDEQAVEAVTRWISTLAP